MTVKETVLQILQNSENDEGWVSGQELAEKCGVTRTSIWKAIEALRTQGASIEAVTNKGYRLLETNLFDADSISAFLPADADIKVDFFKTIDSTNTEAKRRLAENDGKALHKTVIVSAEQTAGRGRLGRKFVSPSNTGIYLSIIYSSGNVTNPALFTANAGVGVARALKSVYGVDAKIKWVNDIFVDGKKVCGILTEGVCNFETGLIEAAIIGIGVNISNNEDLPQEVAGGILSDEKEAAKRSELAAAIITETLKIIDGGESEIALSMKEYKDRSILIGKEIEVCPVIGQNSENYLCIADDITSEAKLVVRLSDGSKKMLDCGEVSIHSKKICYN